MSAVAPYNFVRLPKNVVRVEPEELPRGDRYGYGRFTGSIEIAITNETPLYIGGPVAREAGQTAQSRFFSPTGEPRIPGSELRGMISSLFEIVSWSRIRYVADLPLFYRRFGESFGAGDARDTSTEAYMRDIAGVRAGWITPTDDGFQLQPARPSGRSYFSVARDAVAKQSSLEPAWNRVKVWFKEPAAKEQVTELYTEMPKTASVPVAQLKEGMLVSPGRLDEKQTHWIVPFPEPSAGAGDQRLQLDPEIVREYQKSTGGVTRLVSNNSFSVLPGTNGSQKYSGVSGLPAFYLIRGRDRDDEDTGELVLFGHTRFFRVPYERRMHAAIPAALRDESVLDLTDAMFGFIPGRTRQLGRRGRLAFEDADLAAPFDETSAFEAVAGRRTLYSPRPTSYQHYLEQPDAWARGAAGTVVNWSDNQATIRGVKVFWRRSDLEWPGGTASAAELAKYPAGKPLRPNTVFRGRIRFENLAEHELGALLFILQLPDGCRHALGYGKPFGMGRVRVEVERVRRSLRKDRYAHFLSDGSHLHLPEEDLAPATLAQLQRRFVEWLLARLERIGDAPEEVLTLAPEERIWQHPRLRELRALLDMAGDTNARPEVYMGYAEHRRGNVLPRAIADEAPATQNEKRQASGGATPEGQLGQQQQKEPIPPENEAQKIEPGYSPPEPPTPPAEPLRAQTEYDAVVVRRRPPNRLLVRITGALGEPELEVSTAFVEMQSYRRELQRNDPARVLVTNVGPGGPKGKLAPPRAR